MTRVLMIGSLRIASSDVPLLLRKALVSAGVEVRFLETNEKKFDLKHRKLNKYARVDNRHNASYIKAFKANFTDTALDYEPDLIFIYGSNRFLDSGSLQKVKNVVGSKIFIWEVNNQLINKELGDIVKVYDHIFVLDSFLCNELKKNGYNNVSHLLSCADPEEHGFIEPNNFETDRYGADLTFIGTPYTNRIELMNSVNDLNVKVYGVGWHHKKMKKGIKTYSEPVYGRKKTIIYSASKCSVNLHGDHMIDGENFRVVEAALANCLNVSAIKKDLFSLFSNDEVITFRDNAEMSHLVKKVINDESLLQEYVHKAKEKVLNNHTYLHRANQILEIFES